MQNIEEEGRGDLEMTKWRKTWSAKFKSKAVGYKKAVEYGTYNRTKVKIVKRKVPVRRGHYKGARYDIYERKG